MNPKTHRCSVQIELDLGHTAGYDAAAAGALAAAFTISSTTQKWGVCTTGAIITFQTSQQSILIAEPRSCRHFAIRRMDSGQIGLRADPVQLGGLMVLEDLRIGKHRQYLRSQVGHIDLCLPTIVLLVDLGAKRATKKTDIGYNVN